MHKHLIRGALAASLLLTAATPLAAQATDKDVRCLVASNAVAQAGKDPSQRQFAQLAAFFYMGRLDARMAPAQVRTAALAQGKAMKPADVGGIMRGCAAELQTKSAAIAGPPPAGTKR